MKLRKSSLSANVFNLINSCLKETSVGKFKKWLKITKEKYILSDIETVCYSSRAYFLKSKGTK